MLNRKQLKIDWNSCCRDLISGHTLLQNLLKDKRYISRLKYQICMKTYGDFVGWNHPTLVSRDLGYNYYSHKNHLKEVISDCTYTKVLGSGGYRNTIWSFTYCQAKFYLYNSDRGITLEVDPTTVQELTLTKMNLLLRALRVQMRGDELKRFNKLNLS